MTRNRGKKMDKEKNLENRVKAFLKDEGVWYVKYWGGGGFTRAGVPDLLICCNGVFLGVELKASRGKPSDLQMVELHRIRDSGGLAVLLSPERENIFRNLIHAIKTEKSLVVAACMQILEERMEKYE